jgi:divalent metal cation (Fe/Co/Zn/Cd) transporter
MDLIGSIIIAGYIFFMAYVALKELTLVLVDAVNDPLLGDIIKQHIEKKFNVRVSNILIRPLGYSCAVEASIILNKSPILGEKG